MLILQLSLHLLLTLSLKQPHSIFHLTYIIYSLTITPLYCSISILFFFFSSRRRHTRFDCDWSSDVCSSDLLAGGAVASDHNPTHAAQPGPGVGHGRWERAPGGHPAARLLAGAARDTGAGDRKSGV